MLVISSKQIGSMETSVLRFQECFQNMPTTRVALLLLITVLCLVVDEAQDSWLGLPAFEEFLDSFFCRHFPLHLS